jgi:hypothetical protein
MALGTLKACVRNGRLVMDEPTDLPEGTEVELVAVEDDELEDDERAALHRALDRSLDSVDEGRVRPASQLIDQLRARQR